MFGGVFSPTCGGCPKFASLCLSKATRMKNGVGFISSSNGVLVLNIKCVDIDF